MSDPRAVLVAIGGAERALFYDLNALCRLKTEQGLNLLRPDGLDTDDPTVLRGLIWGGLIHGEPGLTVEQVGGWIDLGNMGAMAQAFAAAFERAATPISELTPDPFPTPQSSGTPSLGSATGSSA